MYQTSLRTAIAKFALNFAGANNEVIVLAEKVVGFHKAVGTQVTRNRSKRMTECQVGMPRRAHVLRLQ